MRRGRPVLGLLGGLLFGLGAALLIQQFGIWPLDLLLLMGMLVLGLLLGFFLAWKAPFGRRS